MDASENANVLLGVLMGVGLAAACGFRVFVPLLIAGLAARSNALSLSSGFDWIGSTPALVCFGVATAAEIGAYFIPWLDNLLDAITTPAAVVAGTLLTAAVLTDVSPWMKWSLAIIAGGGAAGLVQSLTVMTRATSTATTAGIGNPAVSTAELGGSLVLATSAIGVPVIAAAILVLVLVWLVRKLVLFVRRRGAPPATTPGPA